MRSVAPLSVELGQPRVWRAVVVCAGVVAMGAVAHVFASSVAAVLLAALCVGLAAVAWRGAGRWSGVRLVFDAGGGLEIRHRDGTHRNVALDHAVRLGPLLVITVRARDGRRDDVVVWRDQLDADAWRRLKVRVDRRHVSQQNADSVD